MPLKYDPALLGDEEPEAAYAAARRGHKHWPADWPELLARVRESATVLDSALARYSLDASAAERERIADEIREARTAHETRLLEIDWILNATDPAAARERRTKFREALVTGGAGNMLSEIRRHGISTGRSKPQIGASTTMPILWTGVTQGAAVTHRGSALARRVLPDLVEGYLLQDGQEQIVEPWRSLVLHAALEGLRAGGWRGKAAEEASRHPAISGSRFAGMHHFPYAQFGGEERRTLLEDANGDVQRAVARETVLVGRRIRRALEALADEGYDFGFTPGF